VNEIDGGIEGRTFSRVFTPRDTLNHWRYEPVGWALRDGREPGVEFGLAYESEIDSGWRNEYESQAKNKYTNVLVATMLLARKAATIEAMGPLSTSMPSGGRQAKPSRIHRILYNCVEIKRLGESGRHHASPRPHFRRGHYRSLRSGRIISIKPSNVMGGGSEVPIYEAISDSVSEPFNAYKS
jgi:hypothetical protein